MFSFTSAKDIRDYISECVRVSNNLSLELEEMSIGFFNPRKEELKRRKKEIKEHLKKIRKNIKTCYAMLEEYTTFAKDLLLPFLKYYLSLKEGEKYGLLYDVEEFDYTMALATKTFPLNLFGGNYNIITTDSNCKILEESKDSIFGDTDDIEDFLDNCPDFKYLCLEDNSSYTLLEGMNLAEDFKKYPYLYDLANELIDIKLNDPSISDRERLDIVLNELKEKKYNLNALQPNYWRK